MHSPKHNTLFDLDRMVAQVAQARRNGRGKDSPAGPGPGRGRRFGGTPGAGTHPVPDPVPPSSPGSKGRYRPSSGPGRHNPRMAAIAAQLATLRA